MLFCRLSTQWRVGAFGGFFGLDYGALAFIMDAMGIADRLDALDKLQIMEHAALEVLNTPKKP